MFTLMLTGAQTDRHHSSQHSHFDLFMVVIVVTVCAIEGYTATALFLYKEICEQCHY